MVPVRMCPSRMCPSSLPVAHGTWPNVFPRGRRLGATGERQGTCPNVSILRDGTAVAGVTRPLIHRVAHRPPTTDHRAHVVPGQMEGATWYLSECVDSPTTAHGTWPNVFTAQRTDARGIPWLLAPLRGAVPVGRIRRSAARQGLAATMAADPRLIWLRFCQVGMRVRIHDFHEFLGVGAGAREETDSPV